MTLADVQLRPAAVEDLEAIASIFGHYVATTVISFEEVPPTVASWRERLDDLAARGLPFLVAEADSAVVGYAYASPWRPKPAYRYTLEDSIYLAPGWTGKGLGRRLLGELVLECARAGAHQVIAVIADTGDPSSVALHRACGFVDVGRLKQVGHKHGRWVDTVLLQRELVRPES